MKKAILEAKKAILFDEVPVGAVLVDNLNEEIIDLSHNTINTNTNATNHAELILINKSCEKLGTKYLDNTSIFVTLEPCIMCAAAISEVHINKVYFGAYDEHKGGLESITKVFKKNNYFMPEIYGGISEFECSNILKKFFKKNRKNNK